MSDILQAVRESLIQTLQISPNHVQADPEILLLGSIPEFDSMAVLAVLTDLEERFDIEFEDDEIGAEIFETLGSLSAFVEAKIDNL